MRRPGLGFHGGGVQFFPRLNSLEMRQLHLVARRRPAYLDWVEASTAAPS